MTRFAALAMDYYEDPVLEAVGEEWPEVFALWPWLIVQCHSESHHARNPEGWRAMTRQRAGRCLMNPRCAMRELWGLLLEGELIEIKGNLDGKFSVKLVRYAKHQHPFGSSAAFKRHQRQFAGRNGAGVQSLSSDCPPDVHNVSTGSPVGVHDQSTATTENDYPKGSLQAEVGAVSSLRPQPVHPLSSTNTNTNKAALCNRGENEADAGTTTLEAAAVILSDYLGGLDHASKFLQQQQVVDGWTPALTLQAANNFVAQIEGGAKYRSARGLLCSIYRRLRTEQAGAAPTSMPQLRELDW